MHRQPQTQIREDLLRTSHHLGGQHRRGPVQRSQHRGRPVRPLERHRTLHATQIQRHHQPATGSQLLQPRGRQNPHPDRRDDPIVRTPIREPGGPVPALHPHIRGARPSKIDACLLRQAQIDVDAHDVTAGGDQARHHRRVVAGSRADLQDSLTRGQAQLVQHQRHHPRNANTANARNRCGSNRAGSAARSSSTPTNAPRRTPAHPDTTPDPAFPPTRTTDSHPCVAPPEDQPCR